MTLARDAARDEASDIRRSLLRGLVGLMLVLCSAIFGLRLVAAYSDVEELSQALIAAKTDWIEVELQRFFDPAQRGMRVARGWARSGLLRIDDPELDSRLLMPFLRSNELVSAVIVADSSGREFMLLREAHGWLEKRTGLEQPGVVRVTTISDGGERTEHESDQDPAYDPRTRPWFSGALELTDADAVYWTEPYSFYTTREPGITASSRVLAEDGRDVVVAFDVKLRDITRFTSTLEVSPRGRALVIDEGGLVVGLPGDPRLRDADSIGAALLQPAAALGVPEVTSAVAQRASAPTEERALFPFTQGGERWRAGFRPYELAAGRNLLIAVLVPESDLLGDLAAQRNQFLATSALGLLAAVLVALLLDRVIRRRLDRMVSRERRAGQYTLEHEIGRGGMGVVYFARHSMLRRPTAIKILTDHDPNAVARFEREVQLTSRLTHPNTIAVYDYGPTPDGGFYYAMEHLSGITLHTLVENFGPVPAHRTISILRQVCGSLAEAHGMGLVHRDIKPQNIMLCERGGRHDVVKVLDFGLAKDIGVRGDSLLTQPDAITGSPLFLSPEAVRGAEFVEARSDLYSLGAVGYWLLTGQTVFDGTNTWKVCLQHLKEKPVPPSQRVDFEIPSDLEALVMNCLRKHPQNRPTNAVELEQQLGACRDADRWNQQRADEWFRAHAKELEALKTAELGDGQPRQLAIDLGDRLAANRDATLPSSPPQRDAS